MPSISFASLRSSVTNIQRSILDDVWAHLKQNNVGMPERPLFEKYGKNVLHQEAERLGGTIIYTNHEENKLRYNLGVVGVFLTSEGPRLEQLVAKYLELLRDAYEQNREIERFSSKELASWAPALTSSEINELRLILHRAHDSLASRLSGWNAQEWSASVDNDVVELKHVKNFANYVESRILKWYDPKQPSDEIKRMSYQQPSSSNISWVDKAFDPFFQNSDSKSDQLKTSTKRRAKVPRKQISAPSGKLNLSFIADDVPLRRILDADWKEANQNFKAKAWKSCVLLCGGIIEGLLLWQLERAQRVVATNTSADIRYDGEMLSGVIRKSKEQGLIGQDVEFLMEWARIFRNIIHPGNQRRERRTPVKNHAELALKLAQVISESVRKNPAIKKNPK